MDKPSCPLQVHKFIFPCQSDISVGKLMKRIKKFYSQTINNSNSIKCSRVLMHDAFEIHSPHLLGDVLQDRDAVSVHAYFKNNSDNK